MKTQLYVESEEDYQKWIQENTFAMSETSESVAMNQVSDSDTQFLAPYAEDVGVDADTLAQLQP